MSGMGGDDDGGGSAGVVPMYGKREKIDVVACYCRQREVREKVWAVCKSLNIPLVAMRVLNSSDSKDSSEQGTVEFVLRTFFFWRLFVWEIVWEIV